MLVHLNFTLIIAREDQIKDLRIINRSQATVGLYMSEIPGSLTAIHVETSL